MLDDCLRYVRRNPDGTLAFSGSPDGLGCAGACQCGGRCGGQSGLGTLTDTLGSGAPGLAILVGAAGYFGSVAAGSRRPWPWALGTGLVALLVAGRSWGGQ